MNKNLRHKKVISYYEKSRLGYDILLRGSKHFGFYPKSKKGISEKMAQKLMQDLLAKNLKIDKNKLILDAGCGQGIVSTYLARKYRCKIIGITIVPFEVERATKLAMKLGVDNKAEYYLMDYSNTNFKNNHFDAIYTMESFVHSPNIEKTLREFFRILKPGGKLVMHEYTMAEDKLFTDWERKMRDIVVEGSAMESLKSMYNDSFTEILRNVGFESVKERNISLNTEKSLRRLYKISLVPYFFVKLFNLQNKFVNLTAANEFYKMAKKDLFR